MLEAIILGLVQGLTEFLPISSSAHLRILGEFLPNAQDPGAAFTAITQIGTEAAVVVFFWRDIVRIVSHWFGSFTGRVPRNDPDAVARVHSVIRARHTERQTQLLVRANGHVYDACWELHEVDLEEIVLAYLETKVIA